MLCDADAAGVVLAAVSTVPAVLLEQRAADHTVGFVNAAALFLLVLFRRPALHQLECSRPATPRIFGGDSVFALPAERGFLDLLVFHVIPLLLGFMLGLHSVNARVR